MTLHFCILFIYIYFFTLFLIFAHMESLDPWVLFGIRLPLIALNLTINARFFPQKHYCCCARSLFTQFTLWIYTHFTFSSHFHLQLVLLLVLAPYILFSLAAQSFFFITNIKMKLENSKTQKIQ